MPSGAMVPHGSPQKSQVKPFWLKREILCKITYYLNSVFSRIALDIDLNFSRQIQKVTTNNSEMIHEESHKNMLHLE